MVSFVYRHRKCHWPIEPESTVVVCIWKWFWFTAGCQLNSSWENPGHFSFHHHVSYPNLYQRSTHLYFDAALPTFGVTFLWIFGQNFIKYIKMKEGEMSSWPAPPLELIGHTNTVRSVSYSNSPNGCNIATGAFDCTIWIWDTETGVMVGEPLEGHHDHVQCVAYSPDGRRIISGSRDRTIRIWNAETGAGIGDPSLEGHTLEVRTAAYSPDGQRIISGSDDKTIRIWDAETCTAVGKPLQGHTGSVWSVAYSSDGRHIISGSMDKTVRIWNAETRTPVGKPLVHTKPVWSIAYSPKGHHIISASGDGTIRIWEAKTQFALDKPLNGHPLNVCSIAPSPDGRYIVSGCLDNTIHVWDLLSHVSTHHSSSNQMHPYLCAPPDRDGWIRDSQKGLLCWVPPNYRAHLHSRALILNQFLSILRTRPLEPLGPKSTTVHNPSLSFLWIMLVL